jgi:hypothetical protein
VKHHNAVIQVDLGPSQRQTLFPPAAGVPDEYKEWLYGLVQLLKNSVQDFLCRALTLERLFR